MRRTALSRRLLVRERHHVGDERGERRSSLREARERVVEVRLSQIARLPQRRGREVVVGQPLRGTRARARPRPTHIARNDALGRERAASSGGARAGAGSAVACWARPGRVGLRELASRVAGGHVQPVRDVAHELVASRAVARTLLQIGRAASQRAVAPAGVLEVCVRHHAPRPRTPAPRSRARAAAERVGSRRSATSSAGSLPSGSSTTSSSSRAPPPRAPRAASPPAPSGRRRAPGRPCRRPGGARQLRQLLPGQRRAHDRHRLARRPPGAARARRCSPRPPPPAPPSRPAARARSMPNSWRPLW